METNGEVEFRHATFAVSSAFMLQPSRSESVVLVRHMSATTNDRFGDVRHIAMTNVPRLRANAASATWANSNAGRVRTADIQKAFRECQFPMLQVH